MGLFDFFRRKKKVVERKARARDPKLKLAFNKVKTDIDSLQIKANEINNQLDKHSERLDQHNNLLNKHDSEIRNLILQISELQILKQSLSLRPVQAESKTSKSKSKTYTEFKSESKLRPAVKMIEIAEKSILKNMKRIIKNEIFKVIEQEETIPISKLYSIICEEKQFCSRASFFNYMKELKDSGLIENKTIEGQRITEVSKEELKQESKSKTSKSKV
jgi:hypothetical protein